jgi:simple sugar transport system substrate-binding protein
MRSEGLSRRSILKNAAALGAGGALAALLPLHRAHAAGLVVGFIYVGPHDDFGYNQAHAEGAAAVAKMVGVKVLQQENVPEDIRVQQAMESMIEQDGASFLFPTSFGYFNPYILRTAPQFPKVRFEHCGGLWTPKDPKNIGSYFGYIFEAQYINGIVAGYMSKSGRLGFVAAKPIPQVLQNINAFTLGARLVNPKATTSLIFTGDWSMPVKEAEAANSLIDQGVDVLTCHVDSPKVIVETAEKRGIYSSGYHASQAALAPKGYLTGAEWDWSTPYAAQIKAAQTGAPMPNLLRGGLKEGYVKMSPYGAPVSAAAKSKADAIKAEMMKGGFVIFKGALKDNKGNVVIAAGTSIDQFNPELEKMNYLVEGVVGSIPG